MKKIRIFALLLTLFALLTVPAFAAEEETRDVTYEKGNKTTFWKCKPSDFSAVCRTLTLTWNVRLPVRKLSLC